MLCIAAFIVFLVLGIFSAAYRKLAGRAWYCVLRRVTFRPCDINFKEEVKGKLLGKFVFSHPRVAKFLSKWIDWLAAIFVVLTVWSVIAVLLSGLNLMVYDTCNPRDAESCSLGGEACSIGTTEPGFIEALMQGNPHGWAFGHVVQFGETIARVPDRFRTWEAEEFLPEYPSYAEPYDPAKPTTIEIVDPGCVFCAKLTGNMEEAGVFDTHNVAYILYPIPLSDEEYKFPHSELVARWVLALATYERETGSEEQRDWQLLKYMFSAENEEGMKVQEAFNLVYSRDTAYIEITKFLATIGMSEEEIREVDALANSEEIVEQLAAMKQLVEQEVRTVKIPTLLHEGRRYDRVVDVEGLR